VAPVEAPDGTAARPMVPSSSAMHVDFNGRVAAAVEDFACVCSTKNSTALL
jgi:hypothetical protein